MFGAHQQMIVWSTWTVVGFGIGGSVGSTGFFVQNLALEKVKQFLGHTNLMMWQTRTVVRHGSGGHVDSTEFSC